MKIQRALFAFAALLLAHSAAVANVDLGTVASSTPYDPYMRPVKQVLSNINGHSNLSRVQELMRIGRSFRYSFTDPYNASLPAVTAKTKTGDCKAKSLWLADQLGDANIRYVIGKARRTSKISHAWLMWNDGKSWWILDCTNLSKAIPASSISSNEYIPLYSWSKNGTYRHAATSIFTADNAASSNSPVAATESN